MWWGFDLIWSTTAKVPGNNNGLCDITKLALFISAFLLLSDGFLPSYIISIIACYVIHNGTPKSIKNWLWTGVSWFCLVCSSGIALFSQWCMDMIRSTIIIIAFLIICLIGCIFEFSKRRQNKINIVHM